MLVDLKSHVVKSFEEYGDVKLRPNHQPGMFIIDRYPGLAQKHTTHSLVE